MDDMILVKLWASLQTLLAFQVERSIYMEDVINVSLKSKMIRAFISKLIRKKLRDGHVKGDVDVRKVDVELLSNGDLKVNADISATLNFADLTTYIMTK